jgi:hypothetical protein
MIKENLEAIALLKRLQGEGIEPKSEEKEILRKFNGWGAMWQIFKPDHKDHETLKSLLTTEEFEHANASILNAYYTDSAIVKAMWDAVNYLGFDKGKVLEPSCGIGYFMSQAPKWNMWTAVEIDPIPAQISHYLNPSAIIYNQGFEKLDLPDGYFDLAIGNVPFGNYSVFEGRYDGLLIHNHFISKSIDLVRENGLIALISSTGTLDTPGNREFRRSLAKKATLISAMRLPSGTFQNAKTSVTTDLLIFKKSPEPDAKWIENGELQGLPINQYFIDNPENLFGEVCVDSLYGSERLALKSDSRDVPMAIAESMEELKPCYSALIIKDEIRIIPHELQSLPVNAFCKHEDVIYQRLRNKLVRVKTDKRIWANLVLLRLVERLLDSQVDGSDWELAGLRKELNDCYDDFVALFGLVSSEQNKAEFGSDPRYGLLASLDMGGKKAQIFTERTTRAYEVPDQCGSAKDALLHCLNVKGRVDLGWIESRVSG